MIRLLTFLLGKPYETCKSCETLKEQLEYERANNKELVNTLLNIVNPKAVVAAPIELQPLERTSGLWSKRRAALEEKDRQEARIAATSKHLGKPDNLRAVEKLEQELNIPAEPDAPQEKEG